MLVGFWVGLDDDLLVPLIVLVVFDRCHGLAGLGFDPLDFTIDAAEHMRAAARQFWKLEFAAKMTAARLGLIPVVFDIERGVSEIGHQIRRRNPIRIARAIRGRRGLDFLFEIDG